MLRFGLHMALRSGREALVRLLVTALSVGIGVGLLLSVLAMYHAYQGAVATPCWQCTQATSANGRLLWDYDQDTYDGRTIDRVDVATLAPGEPVLPGLSAMPATGQYYASPALATLLRSVPRDQLGDRFPGTLAGTIGRSGLQSPGELAIVVGRTPSALKGLPDTVRISAIDTAPRGLSTSQFYQFGFALGAVALLVPMLVLIGTATRMAAARREERYAAMRLVGAERGQINVVASVDAVVGAVLGAGVGIGIYALLRPLLAHIPLLGYRFFGDMVTPPGWGYVVALVAVPLAATLACLASLRRVRISPLGVTRKVTPKPPRIWRILPLLVGLGMFIIPLLTQPTASRQTPGLAVLALILVMVGLMVAGPWLTMTASRLLARWSRGGSGLLAARRLADNPRASFRAVSGLVLAVMVGTALAALVPAALASQDTTADSGLNNVLRFGTTEIKPADPNEPPGDGLDPAQAAPMLAAIAAVPGTTVIPIYHPSAADAPRPGADPFDGSNVVSCAGVRQMPVFGACPAGATAVLADMHVIYTDNLRALNLALPLVSAQSITTTDDTATLRVTDVMVKVDSAATRERVRTVLSGYRQDLDAYTPPMTFGEVGNVRAQLYLEIQRVVTILAAVTLLIAGCGLAVAISGSLIERKRPFTLMRVTGTDIGTLYRAVLLETVLPLIAATIVAAGVGMALAYPIARALAPGRHVVVLPHPSFYLTLGGGLVAAIAIIVACLPILGRITATESARFE